ncbi:hypothetical protein C4L14_16090 [Enterobacter sp. RC4]|nr:hypothetical protein C4L14_16090 [Enterobacter sp. RC4]
MTILLYSFPSFFISLTLCREVAYITLSSFRVNPDFQDFFSSTDRAVCEVIHIRRVDGGAL